MPIIENDSQSLLALILLDHFHFQFDTTGNDLAKQLSRTRHRRLQGLLMRLKQAKQLGVEYDTILYDFCPSLCVFSRRKRQEQGRVHQHQTRMVKGPNEILPLRM